ncbi:MAG: glucosamine--fructose-6-phosphate aminotransferase (isomerizing) [bacterium]|jgi:glucosamine--fructose-6-phosphate aminotransferase (isomerizing)
MCGISAVIAHRHVAKKLLACLQSLEYRGYDSCGIALYNEGQIELRKNVGDVAQVDEQEHFLDMQGTIGLAHTRWATHGGVSKENSHPHLSNNKKFVIVHNGIISNYLKLREELEAKGITFYSQTDSEVFVNLVQIHYENTEDVEQAFLKAIGDLEGSYAIALLSIHEPDRIYAVKHESPLVLGLSDGATFISSDLNAFISETKDAVLMYDGEYVIVDRKGFTVKSVQDQSKINKEVITIEWDQQTAQKGGYAHYMLKEIFDQPQTIRNVLSISDQEINTLAKQIIDHKQTFLVGVGTTYFVSLVGTYLFSQYANLHTPAVSADEFDTLIPQDEDNHILYLSQSGETYDTLMALRHAQKHGSTTSAIVNVVGSSISQAVDYCILQGSGPEISVVSTKAALAQMLILLRVALRTGSLKGTISQKEEQNILQELTDFPQLIETTLNEESGFIRDLAFSTSHVHNWLFMGRGIYYPIAMESALKMKEVTYLHAEGLPAGFLKHGTLAMIDPTMYSLFFLPSKEDEKLYRSTMSAIEEVKARSGRVIGFCQTDDHHAEKLLDHCFYLPKVSLALTPFLEMIMAQLFSYYSALNLDRSIDKPRNLAKSVTVG